MSVRITVSAPKVKPLAEKFGASDARVREELRAALQLIGDQFVRDMRIYPPERPGQTYIRTGDLGRGWTTPKIITGPAVEIANSVDYARWVQGHDQAWMHVGRWTTINEEGDKMGPQIEQAIRTAIETVMSWIADV